MKFALASLSASMLLACSSDPDVNLTIYVDAPPSDDTSCVGVAAFDVTISPAGAATETRRLVTTTPILSVNDCALPGQFSLGNLDLDASATITVTGYDGTGTAVRVLGRQEVQNLRQASVHLSLHRASLSLPTVLVLYRNPLLDNVPWQDVSMMSISTQVGSMPLLTVDRATTGVLFDREPGAYGISSADLVPGGASKGKVLVVNFTAPGHMTKPIKVTVGDWNGTYYTAN